MPTRHPVNAFRFGALCGTVLAVVLLAGCGAGRGVAYFDDTSPECAPEGVSVRPCFIPFSERPEILNAEEVGEFVRERYPRRLRDHGIGGTVHVWVHVDRQGEVVNVGIARSSGNRELDAAAVEVVKRWRFSPARNDGEAVPVWIQYPVIFRTGRP